jgi:N-acetylglucosamine-6-phosphate deacetylase
MTNSSAPRLFDFQVNGFAGVDFQSDALTGAELRHAVEALREHDTAAIFLTLVTEEIERLCARFARIEAMCAADPSIAAMIAGYHLEGPWMSPEPGYRGAHPPGPMQAPNEAAYRRLQAAAGGRIRLVTLAPEWPGSADFIAMIAAEGIHVSLGHTTATDAQIDSAVAAGARFCTHLGNGVPLMLPRHDNVVQRLLARDELTACFIPDGIHLPPFVLRNFVRAKPAGKVLFTTDCMTAAGAGPGPYTIAGMTIEVGADGIARQPGGGGLLAGSTLTPDEGVRRVASYLQLPLEESRRLWSDAPAAAFGVKLPT